MGPIPQAGEVEGSKEPTALAPPAGDGPRRHTLMGKTEKRNSRPQTTNGDSIRPFGENGLRWALPAAIAAATFLPFLPALHNDFVNWDDEANLVKNPNYRGLAWSQLSWMFTTFHMGHYQPLSWVTLGADYLIWGMNPVGYHLTNLVLHVCNALLVYFLSIRLMRIAASAPLSADTVGLRVSAAVAALIFSLHPLRVESVAWATERRDVLSALFFFAAIRCYLNATDSSVVRSPINARFVPALIFYVLSLLSKASGMVLPAVLLILDIYPLRRFGMKWRDWMGTAARSIYWEKALFLLLGASSAIAAAVAQSTSGALLAWSDYGFAQRIAQAFYGVVFYLWKSLVPVNLSPLYEIPQTMNVWDWYYLASGAAVLGASAVLTCLRHRWPAGFAVWGYYLVVLAPVLGFAQSGTQIAADRYTYLSCVGWGILVGGGFLRLRRLHREGHMRAHRLRAAYFTVAVILIGLGAMTWSQTKIWRDSETLWRSVLAAGESTIANYYFGLTLDREGRTPEAISYYHRALEIRPNYFDARYALAGALFRTGDLAAAARHYQMALELAPGHSDVEVDFANTLMAQGRVREAMEYYQRAIQSDSTNGNAFFNLGNAYVRLGEPLKAIASYRQALRVQSAHSDAHFSLANALVGEGRLGEAIEHYRQAVKYRPEFAEAYHNLGRVLAAQNRLKDAIEQFRRAVRARADFAEAHLSLSQALAEMGRMEEAQRHHLEAVRLMRGQRPLPAPPAGPR